MTVSLKDFLVPIRLEMARVEEIIREEIKPDITILREAFEYVCNSGGKRIRPAIALLSYRLFRPSIPSRLVRLSALLELIHLGTLFHDDVIDLAPLRRGTPSAKEIYGNRISVLTGDYLFARVFTILMEQSDRKLERLLADSLHEVCYGEAAQVSRATDWDLEEDEYLRFLERKTASLFRAASLLGAVLARAPEQAREALASFGTQLGVAFQIQDDLLDYIGKEEETGKPLFSDLKQGKATLPLIHLLRSLPLRESEELKRSLAIEGIQGDGVQGEEIVRLCRKYSSFEYTEEMALCYLLGARNILLENFPSSEARESLLCLIDSLSGRKT